MRRERPTCTARMLPKEERAMRKFSPRIPDALPKTLLKKRLATVRLEDLSSSGGTVECSVSRDYATG
jgi:hypothetical protein